MIFRGIRLAVLGALFGVALLGLAASDSPAAEKDAGHADPASPATPAGAHKIPVILDTDIGGDIDDTWALALLLKSPEVEIKLVVSDTGDTEYRAKIVAKMLEVAKRTDIPVGVGISQAKEGGPQSAWVAGYDLARYPGKVERDGVGAIVRTILDSPEPVTLIAIGPVPNLKAALARNPEIAAKAKFVGMQGSVRLGYGGNPKPDKEYNVVADVKASQKVFTAAWPMLITPLDTCGLIHLTGEKYQKVAQSDDPIARAVIENYRIWRRAKPGDKGNASSILFDTVAVYLSFSTDLVRIERLPIRVTDDGFTRIDPHGKPIDCAMSWKSLPGFEDFLVGRLTGAAGK
ncbi:MAG: nucleoside hydrolase [Thermoguttaceae bacterium]